MRIPFRCVLHNPVVQRLYAGSRRQTDKDGACLLALLLSCCVALGKSTPSLSLSCRIYTGVLRAVAKLQG